MNQNQNQNRPLRIDGQPYCTEEEAQNRKRIYELERALGVSSSLWPPYGAVAGEEVDA